MKTDFHAHFLPGIDDGANTPAESVKILQFLRSRGIERACATPHFAKHGERVTSFLERRKESVQRLDDFIEEKRIDRATLPEIILGAEVHLYEGLSEREGLGELCYQGTRHMLLELPFRKFEGWELEEIYNIMFQLKVTPVMAHINRYTAYYSKSEFGDMFYGGDFILQFNCESSLTHSGASLVKKAYKGGFTVVFGTDLHDPSKTVDCGLDRMLKLTEKLSGDPSDFEDYERAVIGR